MGCNSAHGVGWGGVWYHSSVLQDMMRCYATHGVGWGGVWYHSSVLQDIMRCYATHGVGLGVILFVSTARHDVMLRQYCKTWCDATLRMGWGGVWYHSSVLQDMMRCYATHGVGLGVILFVSTARHGVMLRYAWGGVEWVVISFVITARHDVMLRYAWGGVGCDMISFVSTARHDAMRRYAWGGVGWGGVWYHSFPSPRQTQWFVVQVHSKSTMEMGTHWIRLADRNWRSCKISHAVKRKGHFVRSSGFAAQNPVRVANHSKAVFFWWSFATWNRVGATAKQQFLDNHGLVPGPPGGFTSIQMFHTHTLQREGGKIKVRTMRWKWNEIERKWRWGEDENEMKVTQPGREEGNAKEEGRSKHQHRQTWPKAGKPWKGKGKEKRRPTDTEQDQRRGGRTEAPKPTYHSETYAYLSTRRTQPTCREENTWNRGPMGD